MRSLAVVVVAIFVWTGIGHGQTGVDIQRGVSDGQEAGRRGTLLMPVLVGSGAAVMLSLSDDAELNNNHVVSALVVNTAASAAAVWLTSTLLPPRPSRAEREMLAQQPEFYSSAWRQGFRQTAGSRRIGANVLGVLASAVVSVVVYTRRVE